MLRLIASAQPARLVRWAVLAGVFALSLGALGCASRTSNCTTDARNSIALRVTDENGFLVCDAKVVVHEGAINHDMSSVGPAGSCAWFGLAEQAGTFDLTVSKPGYVTNEVKGVVVTTEPACHHVVTKEVNVQLARAAVATGAKP
ncbi:MAG: hypothetical protein NVS3B20_11480 [Polyangiales bacterium]